MEHSIKHACCILLLILISSCSGYKKESAKNKSEPYWTADLKQELLDMAETDQKIRQQLNKETMSDPEFIKQWADIDSFNTMQLKKLIDSLGWPEIDEIGQDGLEAAFLIVQHSTDAAFQKKMIPLVEKDVKAKHLNPQDYALLVDRSRQKEGLNQIYGTQLTLIPNTEKALLDPIEDSASVNLRRKDLGLTSLGWYLNYVENQTGFDVIGYDPQVDFKDSLNNN